MSKAQLLQLNIRQVSGIYSSYNLVKKDAKNGGAERDRTVDPLLAKQVLSQLSYSPTRLSV